MVKIQSKVFFNWSGGKDSAMSLFYLKQKPEYWIECLLTSVNQEFQRISMHGVRVELLQAQAQAVGISLKILYVPEKVTLPEYDQLMNRQLQEFKKKEITKAVFGDIFLEDLKKYREDQLAKVGIQGIFPIWKIPTPKLAQDFLKLGFKAITVCVNEKFLNKSFVGRVMDKTFFKDLPNNVDPCGENGEYHSFVFDGPIFQKPISFKKGDIIYRRYDPPAQNSSSEVYDTGFWYCDLLPNM